MKRNITLITAAITLAFGTHAALAQNAQSAPAAPAASAAVTTPAQPQAADGAEATVKKAVEGVTAAINADKSVQTGDRARITALVDNKILPYVNAETMTQRAIGPNWAKATAEQKKTLIQEFKTLLINTYAGAFTNYKADTKIEYKPTRASDDSAVVRSTVITSGRDPVPIDYYMEKQADGWKLVDLSVFNARLVELYKSQFNAAIAQGGVDGLIKILQTKNGTAKS